MYVDRSFYLKQLIGHKDNKLIKIITGARRVGKSILLFEIYTNYLIKHGVNKNQILIFKMDEKEYAVYKDANKLIDFVKTNRLPSLDTYVFIDEVQNIKDFEEMLNSLNFGMNCKVYVTGSNSKMLSFELNTLLRGRTVEIRVFPLSFAEIYNSGTYDKEILFEQYLTFGGLPELLYYSDKQFKVEYLASYNKDIVAKDIIERYHLKENNQFMLVYKIIASSIGSKLSAKKIADTFISMNYKSITVDTIQNYLRFMKEANLVFEVSRYDIKGRRYLSFQNKYYMFDPGVRNQILNFRQIEKTHLLENIVYNELLRRYKNVDIGINKSKEIDFVVNNIDRKYYVQVSLNIENEDVKEREISSFYGLDDGYKKIIITKSSSLFKTIGEGYLKMDIFDFLLNDDALEKA